MRISGFGSTGFILNKYPEMRAKPLNLKLKKKKLKD